MSGSEGTAIVRQEQGGALARPEDLDLGVPIERLIQRVKKIRAVQVDVMEKGRHYGKIPGVDKPTLLKPGAEILGLTFQLAPKFKIEDRWDGEHLECVVTCTLVNIPTEHEVGEGVGSCSTKESKYAFRQGQRKCPKCGETAIIKGKEEYGGGWLCWKKPEKNKNGCGAKFKAGDKSIESQEVGRIANADLADQYNTVRKMACKRAHVAAILFATCASEVFTQDVEDLPRDGAAPAAADDDDRWRDSDDNAPASDRAPTQGRQQQQQQEKPRDAGGDETKPTSAQHTSRMTAEFLSAGTLQALEALVPQLQQLKDDRCLTLDDYKKLRAAYSARATALKDSARQSA